MGDERAGRGAALDRLQHRALDLGEAQRRRGGRGSRGRRRAGSGRSGGCARWPRGRRSAAGSGSRRRSARGACRAAAAAPWPAARTPRRGPRARPGGWSSRCPSTPTQSPRSSSSNTAVHRGADDGGVDEELDVPVRSRSVAKVSPPWWRMSSSRPATRTRSGVRVPGGRSGCLSRTCCSGGRSGSGRAGRGRPGSGVSWGPAGASARAARRDGRPARRAPSPTPPNASWGRAAWCMARRIMTAASVGRRPGSRPRETRRRSSWPRLARCALRARCGECR